MASSDHPPSRKQNKKQIGEVIQEEELENIRLDNKKKIEIEKLLIEKKKLEAEKELIEIKKKKPLCSVHLRRNSLLQLLILINNEL